ncbi:MAG: septal ring lytic transglycosylase RlpA family protein, partial [Pseudomonadota bacterium]
IPMPGDQPKSARYYKVGSPYKIKGKRYYPKERFRYSETGIASWYGPNFHGKQTANGEIFNKYELTAAHRTLQMPSIIRVTNLSNGRALILRVNDRGPFAHNRVLDVSERAAELLGFKGQGTTRVRIDVLEDPSRQVAAMAKQRIDTTGYEVALNRNRTFTRSYAQYTSNNDEVGTRSYAQRPTTTPVNIDASTMAIAKPIKKPTRVASSQQTASLSQIAPAAQAHSIRPSPKPQYEPITTMSLNTPAPKPTTTTAKPLEIAGLKHSQSTMSPNPTFKPSNFFIQAGSFREEQNALNFSQQLASFGPSKVYLTRSNNIPTYRVKLGPYASNDAAKQALTSLEASGKNGIVIAE